MSLTLDRPLAFLDLETTGVNVATDRIVEISILKLFPDGKEQVYTQRVNPTVPIPAHTTEIHGISDEDVKDEPTFAQIANKVFKLLFDSDLAGFNSNRFDVPCLVEEFFRVDVVFDPSEKRLIDVQNIFHKMEQRTLVAAYKFYCSKDLTNAHSAEADTRATYEVFLAQLERYDDLPKDVEGLAVFSRQNRWIDFAGRFAWDDDDVPVFNFGKFKGQPVEQVLRENSGYYGWIMHGDFPNYTKKVITDLRNQFFEAGKKRQREERE